FRMKYTAFALLVAMIGLTEARMQNVTVKGIAICDKHRMGNVIVELWEKDTMDPNDKLAEVHTNHNGEFHVTGGDNEVTAIAPYMKFRHSCKASVKPGQKCTRKTEYTIPSEYIWNADADLKDRKVYDMTYVTLDIFVSGEKEHCEKL
ncbi:hypothetical protein PMAYCL1PPCAC_20669, partial [Pristionchus mayeri]